MADSPPPSLGPAPPLSSSQDHPLLLSRPSHARRMQEGSTTLRMLGGSTTTTTSSSTDHASISMTSSSGLIDSEGPGGGRLSGRPTPDFATVAAAAPAEAAAVSFQGRKSVLGFSSGMRSGVQLHRAGQSLVASYGNATCEQCLKAKGLPTQTALWDCLPCVPSLAPASSPSLLSLPLINKHTSASTVPSTSSAWPHFPAAAFLHCLCSTNASNTSPLPFAPSCSTAWPRLQAAARRGCGAGGTGHQIHTAHTDRHHSTCEQRTDRDPLAQTIDRQITLSSL